MGEQSYAQGVAKQLSPMMRTDGDWTRIEIQRNIVDDWPVMRQEPGLAPRQLRKAALSN